jgi:hypothetical protein
MSKIREMTITSPSRRALLAGAPAAAAALATGAAADALAVATGKPTEVEPIFSIIAEHQAALESYLAASAAESELFDDTPEWIVAHAAAESAWDREVVARKAVFTTDPTTVAGILALLEHVSQHEFLKDKDEQYLRKYPNERGLTILSALGEYDNEWRWIGKKFPLRIATALRNIIERGQA